MLPNNPMINEAELRRGKRPYEGEITPGDVFAWEPDLPYARELVVVKCITKTRVCTRPLNGDEEVWNDLSRFREAVVPTAFNRMPPTRPASPVAVPELGFVKAWTEIIRQL